MSTMSELDRQEKEAAAPEFVDHIGTGVKVPPSKPGLKEMLARRAGVQYTAGEGSLFVAAAIYHLADVIEKAINQYDEVNDATRQHKTD